MLKTLYEHEKSNNIIYDGLREYCVTEKVNEEYLRASIRAIRLGYKHVTGYMIMAVFGVIRAASQLVNPIAIKNCLEKLYT